VAATVDDPAPGVTGAEHAADGRSASLEAELRSVRELFLIEAQRVAHLQRDLVVARAEALQKGALLKETAERSEIVRQNLVQTYQADAARLSAELENRLAEAAQIRKGILADLDRGNRIVHSLRRSLGDLLGVNERALNRAGAAEDEVVSLQCEIVRLRDELVRVRTESAKTVAALRTECAGAVGVASSLRVDLAELQVAQQSLESTLNGALTSRSWRVTRPLRWALRVVLGGRGRR